MMDLDDRVAALERRVAALEAAGQPAATTAGATPPATLPANAANSEEGLFWALETLKARLAGGGATDGGVLFTGVVRLPTDERYEWQQALPTEALMDASWSGAAESFAALGNPVRLRLLHEILRGRRTVTELTALADMGTTGQIYHHLRQLTSAGWLRAAGRGRYEVPSNRVVPLLVALAASEP